MIYEVDVCMEGTCWIRNTVRVEADNEDEAEWRALGNLKDRAEMLPVNFNWESESASVSYIEQ